MTTRRLPQDLDDLPASLVELAEVLGFRVAVKLMQHFGGQEIKFPKFPGPDHPVIRALGETDGHALCSYLGGAAIYVPHSPRGTTRRDVMALEAAGHDRRAIARRLGISQRHVRRTARTRSHRDDQGDLFD